MKRVLEPELMDDTEQVLAYAQADFSASNQAFVDRVAAQFPGRLRRVLDIGCGPGDVVIRLARTLPEVRVTAVDGSPNMLAYARQAVAAAGLAGQITLRRGRVPGLQLGGAAFDTIMSKDLLHHLHDPLVLWQEIRRLGTVGTAVFVMDLFRPATPQRAREIVENAADDEAPILKADFFNSLCAAFTPDEVTAQLREANLPLRVETTSERHMAIYGHLE